MYGSKTHWSKEISGKIENSETLIMATRAAKNKEKRTAEIFRLKPDNQERKILIPTLYINIFL